MDVKTIQKIDRDIKKTFSLMQNQDIYRSKFWKSFFNFKSIRVGVIFATIIGLLVLRFYLPIYRAEKLAVNFDQDKVKEIVGETYRDINAGKDMFLQGAEKQYQKWKKQTEELISLDLARLNIESFKSMLVTRQQELQKRITGLLRSKSEDLQIKGLRILRKLGEKAHFAERDLERLLGSANSDVKIETIKTVAKIGLNSGCLLYTSDAADE